MNVIQFDGGAVPNPGAHAIGVIIIEKENCNQRELEGFQKRQLLNDIIRRERLKIKFNQY